MRLGMVNNLAPRVFVFARLRHSQCLTAGLQAKGDSSGAAYKQRYSRASGSGLLDGAGRRPWATGRTGEEVGGGGEAPPALRARVLPGSEQFDPQLYLGSIHAVGVSGMGGWEENSATLPKGWDMCLERATVRTKLQHESRCSCKHVGSCLPLPSASISMADGWRLQETALPDLVRGLAALRSQLSEHTGQLKALVKENFDRFISRCAGLGAGC